MKYSLFYIVSIILFIAFFCFTQNSNSNLNGAYIGVDFGHSSFRMKVMEAPKMESLQIAEQTKPPIIVDTPPLPASSLDLSSLESSSSSSRLTTPTISISESSHFSSEPCERHTYMPPRISPIIRVPFIAPRNIDTPSPSLKEPVANRFLLLPTLGQPLCESSSGSRSSSNRSFVYVSSPSPRFIGRLDMSRDTETDDFVKVPTSPHVISSKGPTSPIPKIIKSLSPCYHQNKRENYPSIFLKGGHGTSYRAFYIGGEFKVGYNLAHNSTRSLSHEWNLGISGKAGIYATDDWLIYLRMGLDHDQLTLKNEDNVYLWSLVRGIGTDHMISEKIFLSFGVEHSIAISHSASVKVVNRQTSSTTIKTGMGFKI